MSKMRQKDYELIAKAIRAGYWDLMAKYRNHDTFVSIAHTVAIELTENNPRFDRNKFLKSCGVENE